MKLINSGYLFKSVCVLIQVRTQMSKSVNHSHVGCGLQDKQLKFNLVATKKLEANEKHK